MLKIIFDTNTLISAIGWRGLPYQTLIRAIQSPNIQVFITQTIYDELEENFEKEKLKKYYPYYKNFKNNILDEIIILENNENKIEDEDFIPGIKDREIYRTARANNIDIIVTGDKPFLNSGVSGVQIIDIKHFFQEIIQD